MREPCWKTFEITFMASASQDAELFGAFTEVLRVFDGEWRLSGVGFDRSAVARCARHLLDQFSDEAGSQLTLKAPRSAQTDLHPIGE